MSLVLTSCFLAFIRFGSGDWVSEWLSPVQSQLNDVSVMFRDMKHKEHDKLEKFNLYVDNQDITKQSNKEESLYTASNISPTLEEVLNNAITLSDNLSKEISHVSARELILKDAIANGRSGVSTLTVTAIGKTPRTYIIRDTYWTLCNGIIEYPISREITNFYARQLSAPRCIGDEISSRRDPCVFNSIIRYETIPTARRKVYKEDDYLCLKPNFNSTLETYLSVPKHVITNTCKNGISRSLNENLRVCGSKTVAEYTYYPLNPTAWLPSEYCTSEDGSFTLTVAWQISNETLENFEFLKKNDKFKKIFTQL